MPAQKILPARTNEVAKFKPVYISEEVYLGSEILVNRELPAEPERQWIEYKLTAADIAAAYASPYSVVDFGNLWEKQYWTIEVTQDAVPIAYPISTIAADVAQYNRALARRLCEAHPDISTDPKIFGGNPHIKNVRLTVGNILAKLYHYGNISAVANIYKPHVSEDQIKEAIAYAQDFLEAAIHPHEPSEVDG